MLRTAGLSRLSVLATGLLLSILVLACAPAAPPTPTPAPPKPGPVGTPPAPTTAPAKPAAPAPTTAPAKPAAPAPTAAPAKPAPTAAPAKPAATTAPARPPIKVISGNLAVPSLVAPGVAIIKAKDIGKKHGIDLELKDYADISAYYAALSTGEVHGLVGGTFVLQRMRNQGIPVKGISTYADVAATHVLTADPNIKEFKDIKGKTLAADNADGGFQLVLAYAKSKGIDLRKDATIVQSTLPLARQRLKTGEVATAVANEPTVTLSLVQDNPNYRSIFDGKKAWQELAGGTGAFLVYMMRDDLIKANPEAPRQMVAALKDMTEFVRTNIDEADAIVTRDVKLPAGIFKQAVQSGRMLYTVEAAWDEKTRQSLEQMFKIAVDVGHLDKVPADALYRP